MRGCFRRAAPAQNTYYPYFLRSCIKLFKVWIVEGSVMAQNMKRPTGLIRFLLPILIFLILLAAAGVFLLIRILPQPRPDIQQTPGKVSIPVDTGGITDMNPQATGIPIRLSEGHGCHRRTPVRRTNQPDPYPYA